MSPDTKTVKHKLKCSLSPEALSKYGRELAELHRRKDDLAAEKKQVMNGFKSRESNIEVEVNRLSNIIHDNFEVRDVLCVIHLHTPEEGKKTIIRTDTEEEIEVSPMTQEELQTQLDLDAQAEHDDILGETPDLDVEEEPDAEEDGISFDEELPDPSEDEPAKEVALEVISGGKKGKK